MKHACKNTRKHVAAIVAYLREIGAEVGTVTRTRCLHLAFSYGGRSFVLPVRNTDTLDRALRSARKLVRRMLRAEHLPLPAAVAVPA